MITYFIRSGDFVKIGRTENLKRRMSHISYALPQAAILLKVCAMPEKVAHEIAGKITKRAKGEWFEVNAKLIKWIKAVESVEADNEPHFSKTLTIYADVRRELEVAAKQACMTPSQLASEILLDALKPKRKRAKEVGK